VPDRAVLEAFSLASQLDFLLETFNQRTCFNKPPYDGSYGGVQNILKNRGVAKTIRHFGLAEYHLDEDLELWCGDLTLVS
jgi:hypothetical protein